MNLGDYRFGFQNQETDPEIYGTGNAVSYKYRVEYPRLGRFLSIDPLAAKYPFYSPYAFSGNRVIDAVELEGLEPAQIVANEQGSLQVGYGELPSDNPGNSGEIAEYTLNEVTITAQRSGGNNSHTLTEYNPTRNEKFREYVKSGKADIITTLAYDGINSTWVGVQDFFMPWVDKPRNWGGGEVSGSEREDGAVAWAGMMLEPINSINLTVRAGGVVEQYSLRASSDGFYPVMKRGFSDPQELVFLKEGDVWKFGTTKNPATRYSQSYLNNIGEYGVIYETEFTGTLKQVQILERMKILNYKFQTGFLPAGNKIVK